MRHNSCVRPWGVPMRRLISLLDRFRRDEGGAFAMIFAMLAIVLIATAGAAVDFTELQQSRNPCPGGARRRRSSITAEHLY